MSQIISEPVYLRGSCAEVTQPRFKQSLTGHAEFKGDSIDSVRFRSLDDGGGRDLHRLRCAVGAALVRH